MLSQATGGENFVDEIKEQALVNQLCTKLVSKPSQQTAGSGVQCRGWAPSTAPLAWFNLTGVWQGFSLQSQQVFSMLVLDDQAGGGLFLG